MRAQTSLPAIGVAFLVLTASLVVGLVAADAALRSAERPALDRKAAVGVSEALVRASAPTTDRANVVNGSRLANLTLEDLRGRYGLPADASVRLALDDRTLLSHGTPAGGVTVERVVLVERRRSRSIDPALRGSRAVTLPRRTESVNLTVRPPANSTLRSVRVDGRVRLHNASGLNGTYDLPVSSVETVRLHFDAVGPLSNDSVRIRYSPVRTRKARLGVTIGG